MSSKKRQRLISNARHFTLLEMTIAILLLAGLVGIVMMSASAITSSWERMNTEKERFSELLVLDRTLDSLLSNAVPFLWGSDELEYDERPVFTGRHDEIGLATMGQVHTYDTGGLIFAHIQVEDDNLVVYYQSRPMIRPDDPESARKFTILAEGVDRIECLYADVSTEGDLDWLDEWDMEDERMEIPLAILIRVFWLDGKQEAWLRRTAGSGKHERFGKWKAAGETPFIPRRER